MGSQHPPPSDNWILNNNLISVYLTREGEYWHASYSSNHFCYGFYPHFSIIFVWNYLKNRSSSSHNHSEVFNDHNNLSIFKKWFPTYYWSCLLHFYLIRGLITTKYRLSLMLTTMASSMHYSKSMTIEMLKIPVYRYLVSG